MDARDGSADVVEVEALGRRESKVAAAVKVRSIDYQPIVDDAVAGLAPTTADKRCNVYAHARSVVTRGLVPLGLPETIVELEKLALDLAIARVERRWRAKEAADEFAAEQLAAKKAIRPIVPEPRITPSAIANASTAASLLRGVAWPVGVAVALPVIAAMIFFASHVDHKVADRSAAGDRVPRRFSHHNADPSRTVRVAARNVPSAYRSPGAAPIRDAFPSASEASAPSLPSPVTVGGKLGNAVCPSGSPASARDSCARDTMASIAAAQMPKTEAVPLSIESYSPFSDMTWGRGPANALNGPTVAAEDFVVGRVMAYAAPTPAAALTMRAAAPRAPMRQESVPPATKPVNAKVAALIASGKQSALKGDLDRTLRDLGEAIRIDPKYPDSYLERGKTYFKLGETERAIADYAAALAHDPQHAAAFRARGMAHLYSGKNDLALADLSKAIELAEHDPRLLAPIELFYARRSRAALYDSKQQYDLEIADCTAVIESSTHDPMLAEAIAANYGSAGTANILAKLHRQRANALVRTSRADRAVADLTEAIRLSSDRGYAALLDRAKLHELLGRRDLAVADARAALNIRPSSEEARLEVSRLSDLSSPAPPKGL